MEDISETSSSRTAINNPNPSQAKLKEKIEDTQETSSSRTAMINNPDLSSQAKLKEKIDVPKTSGPRTAMNNPESSRKKLKGRMPTMEDIPEISGPHIAVDMPFDPVLHAYTLKLDLASFGRENIVNQAATIFRFPLHIRQRRTADIRPRVVSIGPFFHGDTNFEGMEQQKPIYMWELLKRCGVEPDPLSELLTIIRKLETRARECYCETIELVSVDFVRMLLLDSCFIICFLISISQEIDERLIALDWNIKEIRSDLLLLENQIPFFVVSAVYECIISLLRQIKNLPSFGHILEPFVYMDIPSEIQVPCDVAYHLLHLYWLCFLPNENGISSPPQRLPSSLGKSERMGSTVSSGHGQSSVAPSEEDSISEHLCSPFSNKNGSFSHYNRIQTAKSFYESSRPQTATPFHESNWAEITVLSDATKNIPSATELHRVAGVVFNKSNSKLGFKVEFRYGIMEMSSLKIDQSRKIILTNLIGYEKYLHPQMRKVSSYMLLMGSLINTEEDVEFLQESGVVLNGLSSNSSATTFFNEIGDLCIVDHKRQLFADVFRDVDKYYNSKWNRRFATLQHNYFNNPWAGLAVFAAVFLLVINVAQTIFAGFQTIYTIHPPHN